MRQVQGFGRQVLPDGEHELSITADKNIVSVLIRNKYTGSVDRNFRFTQTRGWEDLVRLTVELAKKNYVNRAPIFLNRHRGGSV